MAAIDGLMWLDGELVTYEQARVPFLAPALHYGLAVFEGIRCYETPKGPAVFRLREHLQRFYDSMRVFGMLELPFDIENLRQAVHDVILANQLRECYIRPLMFMIDGPLGLNLDKMKPSVGIAAWAWDNLLGNEAREHGIRMMVSSFTRHHPNVTMTKAKISGNYVNSVMAQTLAARAGFDETVMLDPGGFVAECSGENLFLVRDQRIYTPPRVTILEGITRDSVITLATDLGYPVIEEPISRDQLYIAEEIFVCGTAAEVVPVREVDTRPIGDGGMGTVTRAIQQLFFQTVHGEGARARNWLDWVDTEKYAQVIAR
jgi:branched-chain amino acid aminotransferase